MSLLNQGESTVKYIKYFVIATLALALLMQIKPQHPLATTAAAIIPGQQISAQPAQNVSAEPAFHRGYTNKQDQPCFNIHTKEYYESELIGKNETAHNLILAGATVQQADILSAISHAESGSQINCWGDDDPKYYGKPTADGRHWGESYGLYQIRTIIEAKGTGECRDIERLKLNIIEQSKCAMELSNGGTKFSPTWSMYTNGRYKQWLGQNW